jgi:hypothetical protein
MGVGPRTGWLASLATFALALAVAVAVGPGSARMLAGVVMVAAIFSQAIFYVTAWRRTRPHSARDLFSYRWMFHDPRAIRRDRQ